MSCPFLSTGFEISKVARIDTTAIQIEFSARCFPGQALPDKTSNINEMPHVITPYSYRRPKPNVCNGSGNTDPSLDKKRSGLNEKGSG